MKDVKYVLATPVKNEGVCVGRTIEAVVSQTVLPQEWVIASDGSTDRTDEIASGYARKHSFIQPLESRRERPKRLRIKSEGVLGGSQ
jgi:poly-beta-1,6-N-acetyl-D-glucosamine synthase